MLTNLKFPCAIFLLYFSNIEKSILKNFQITGAIFLLISFPYIKKSIHTNLKLPGAAFLYIPFSHIKKKHTS